MILNLSHLKKAFLLFSIFFPLFSAFAQAPEKMSYQAVIRNTANALITNQVVGMKISILQGSASGAVIYAETQTPTSNNNGLVTLEIGGGTPVTGTFASINWANGSYFIKTETDPTGGTSYTITGTSQLLSTPYALYAKTSGNSTLGDAGGIQVLNASSGSTFTFTSTTARHYILDFNNNTNTLVTPSGTYIISIPSASSFAAGTVINITAVGTTAVITPSLTSSGSTFSGFNHANANTFTTNFTLISFVSNGSNRWFRIN